MGSWKAKLHYGNDVNCTQNTLSASTLLEITSTFVFDDRFKGFSLKIWILEAAVIEIFNRCKKISKSAQNIYSGFTFIRVNSDIHVAKINGKYIYKWH